jgi:hypothetical protein
VRGSQRVTVDRYKDWTRRPLGRTDLSVRLLFLIFAFVQIRFSVLTANHPQKFVQ